MADELTIGALAKRADCQAETIRYYEREGLLPAPARSQGNYRLYGRAHLERLSFIRRCRSLDMALDEIRILLHFSDAPASDCSEVNILLDEHIRHVADRITDLRRLERQLKDLRASCAGTGKSDRCGILTELSQGDHDKSKSAPSGHVRGSHSGRKAAA
jgi:Cd(II)/Pb(II)-responsive transcriptional regulator